MSYFRKGLSGLGDAPPAGTPADRLVQFPGHSLDDPNCAWVGVPITESIPGYQQVCPDNQNMVMAAPPNFIMGLLTDLVSFGKNIVSGVPATAGRGLLTADAEIPKAGMTTTTKVAIAGAVGLTALLLLRSSKR